MKRFLCARILALSFVVARSAGAEGFVPPITPFGPRGLVLEPPSILREPGDAGGALPDIYVTPTRPGQNVVPYWQYDWHTFEFSTDRGGGGVRLFFYEREREASSYAVAALQREYVRLTDSFHYLPRSTIPFVLYASYPEFLATNVFFITEGTLGVTDPRDLRMAVPFFGDIHYFTRVSTHEMVHQITLQKIRDASLGARVEPPLNLIPLWFIEGIAEWGTFDGMDPEGDFIVRDLITSPDPEQGYMLPDFFDERAGGFIGVYKLGQAKLTFLAETYGRKKVVDLLERIPLLAGTRSPGGTGNEPPHPRPEDEHRPPPDKPEASERPDDEGLPPDSQVTAEGSKKPVVPRSFEEYIAIVVGEPPQRIRERYTEWLKKRYYRDWLDAKQRVSDFVQYKPVAGEPDAMSVSEDGHLILYRTVERETGSSVLWLQDLRDPGSREEVVRDQRPGVESLHPVDRRVTALRGNVLVFAARSKDNDHMYVQTIRRRERVEGGRVKVQLRLGSRKEIDLDEVMEVYDPALSPDSKSVAFAGVAPDGFRDLYVVALEGPNRGKPVRLTHDVWSESDVAWDGDRLLYASDHSETHHLNLYAFDLETRQSERLTFHEDDDRNPVPGFGGVVYRSLRSGKPDLWLLKDGVEKRLTDTAAAMLVGAPTSNDALLAIGFYSGSHRLYRIPKETFLAETPEQAPGIGGAGLVTAQRLDYPQVPLPADTPRYNPRSPSNWRLEATAGALVGPVSVGAAGLAITDLLRDHLVLVNLAVYGSFKLTDASAFYINQSKRPELGIGAFHTFEAQRDKTFPEVGNYYLQREFGAAGLIRYPIDRFRRVEGSLEIRGIERFSFTDYTGDLSNEWQRRNGGIEPEVVASGLIGYDTTRLHALAGPIEGTSLMGSASLGYLPVREFAYARFLGDAQQRFRIIGRTNLLLRAAVGTSTAGRFAPQFFLSSVDNLEGYHFGDIRLLGDNFYATNVRLNVPVDWLVQVPFFTGLYAIGGFDFGAVFDHWHDAWQERSLAAVLGGDVALGGILFQFHWGKLLSIQSRNGPEAWVFNLNLKYLYF